MSLLRIITLVSVNDPLISMIIYFSAATILLLISLFCYWKCEKEKNIEQEGIKEHLNQEYDEFRTNSNDFEEKAEVKPFPFLFYDYI